MIENYGMFNLHENNNTLLLLFSDAKITNEVKHNEVISLYNNESLIGYRIVDFIKHAKIKYSGIIFLPNNVLIDVINDILINEGLEPLAYKTSSGYFIEDINGHKVVNARPGTFLRDGSVSKGHICSYHDLYIDNENPNEILYVDEINSTNRDFFLTEVK